MVQISMFGDICTYLYIYIDSDIHVDSYVKIRIEINIDDPYKKLSPIGLYIYMHI